MTLMKGLHLYYLLWSGKSRCACQKNSSFGLLNDLDQSFGSCGFPVLQIVRFINNNNPKFCFF